MKILSSRNVNYSVCLNDLLYEMKLTMSITYRRDPKHLHISTVYYNIEKSFDNALAF